MSLTVPNTITELVPDDTFFSLTVDVGIKELTGIERTEQISATLLPYAMTILTNYESEYEFDADTIFNEFKPSADYYECPSDPAPVPIPESVISSIRCILFDQDFNYIGEAPGCVLAPQRLESGL